MKCLLAPESFARNALNLTMVIGMVKQVVEKNSKKVKTKSLYLLGGTK